MINGNLICLLDKAAPPEHSFVDGLLCSSKVKRAGVRVVLICSAGDSVTKTTSRYNRTLCLVTTFRRKGVGRFLHAFAALILTARLLYKTRGEADRTILVRNDPLLLLVGSAFKPLGVRLVFQSSFPHEIGARKSVKTRVAQVLIRILCARVDAFLAVSPTGCRRLNGYAPNVCCTVIPLLVDVPAKQNGVSEVEIPIEARPLRLIYIGTHAAPRRLDVVLGACADAWVCGADIEVRFVGGTTEEVDHLSKIDRVDEMIRRGRMSFVPRVPRALVADHIDWADVGLSLIPPSRIYQEASPTKLGEYFIQGKAVLASLGIPLQERWVEDSGGGVLVEFSIQQISHALQRLAARKADVKQMGGRARVFALGNLRYDTRVEEFLSVCFPARYA